MKEVTFNEQMKKKLVEGINLAVNAASETVGPAGRQVIVQQTYGSPTITKDGITVLKAIEVEDPIVNLGVKLVTDASQAANEKAGDGSTTTAILTGAIVNEGLKLTSVGVNPIGIKEGINAAVEEVVERLHKLSKEIETKDQIKQVASISANNDEEIGNLVAEAIDRVGSDGVITVGESRSTDTYTDIVEGMQFDKGFISPYFCTDKENLVVNFENACILVYDKKISSVNSLMPILNSVMQQNRPLLIVADDVDGEALAALALNALRGTLQVCAVKAPGFGDRKKAMLEDIAALTGAQLVDEEIGMKLETHGPDCLGEARTIKVTKDATTIIDGFGDEAELVNRINQLRRDIENATSDYDKEKLQERLAKLTGGVAVINVGATTEAELKEKKFRLEDSLNATRSAIAEGIIPGGGSALLHISFDLRHHETPVKAAPGYDSGYQIVVDALSAPIKRIAENAGWNGELVADRILSHAADEKSYGWDALRNEYGDMLAKGIIDPVKVTRCALENAASVASLALTSNCTITVVPEKEAGPNPMAGMSPMM